MRHARVSIVVMAGIAILIAIGPVQADNGQTNPHRLFYEGNSYYAKRDYVNALLAYDKVLKAGFESGNLDYNIGNAFFKIGKMGYAILFYERARRLIPQDSDLRSNLLHARSLVNNPPTCADAVNSIVRLAAKPFVGMNLEQLLILNGMLYVLIICVIALIVWLPAHAKKIYPVLIILLAAGVYAGAIGGMRYYEEIVQTHGIIVVKDAEAKYEPIDKSTTYYKLTEGQEVIILNTKDDWRHVRRFDGKIAWIKKEAAEKI